MALGTLLENWDFPVCLGMIGRNTCGGRRFQAGPARLGLRYALLAGHLSMDKLERLLVGLLDFIGITTA